MPWPCLQAISQLNTITMMFFKLIPPQYTIGSKIRIHANNICIHKTAAAATTTRKQKWLGCEQQSSYHPQITKKIQATKATPDTCLEPNDGSIYNNTPLDPML
jgi:hypothetical protein